MSTRHQYQGLALSTITTMAEAVSVSHTLSDPSKMPGFAYSIPARACKVGAKLLKVVNSVCSKCYALKGRYVFPNVIAAMERRLMALFHPLWVEAMAYQINYYAHRERGPKQEYFRWHDSGDLQGIWHLEKIISICLFTPDVKHWLPTRELTIVREYLQKHGGFPPNLIVRISAPMIGEPILGLGGIPVSTVGLDTFGFQCRAGQNGGKCESCRACWTPVDINYQPH